MITTDNLGLAIWNNPTDGYDSEQLGENWARVDQHDHTPGKGIPIGTPAIEDFSITQEKLAPGLTLPMGSLSPGQVGTLELANGSVTTPKYANDSLTTAKVAPSAITFDKLADGAVLDNKLDVTTVLDKIGLSSSGMVRRGKSIVPTEQARTNVAFGTLSIADQVSNVLLPQDGLIFIGYQAMWKESVANGASAAIFLDTTQLKTSATGAAAPAVQEAITFAGFHGNPTNRYTPLTSTVAGLWGDIDSIAYTGDVATGQILGRGFNSVAPMFGVTTVFASAGTYDVSVQFKASTGTVTAKNRKLWVWTMGF